MGISHGRIIANSLGLAVKGTVEEDAELVVHM